MMRVEYADFKTSKNETQRAQALEQISQHT